MNIILIGFRGVGKTSVGRELAQVLDRPFLDCDTLLEQRQEKKIRQLFEEEGEDAFRLAESDLIRRVAKSNHAVIATGGGMVTRERNVARLKKNGIFIWLTASPEVILDRLKKDMEQGRARPLLGEEEDLLAEILHHLKIRLPLYRRIADGTVDTSARDIPEVVQRIHAFLAQHPGWSEDPPRTE